jgi:hypothetical protein
MKSLKNSYIRGIVNEFAGKRDQIIADLVVFLENPVGVGDHGDISRVIKEKIDSLDALDSKISTIQKYFFNEAEESQNENDKTNS